MRAWGLVLALSVGACASHRPPPPRGAEPVRIGLLAPLTGPWSRQGQQTQHNVALRAERLNAAGGLLGRPVEVVIEDDAGDAKTAVAAARRLVARGVVAVVGTYGSAITEAVQPVLADAGVVHVANGSTAVRLTEKGLGRFFRTCPRNDAQGRVAAAELGRLGATRIALLHDGSVYSKGLADRTVEALGGRDRIVLLDALAPGQQDYSAVLARMRAAGADAVFFTGYYPEAAVLLKQRQQLGWDVPFLGGDATNSPALVAGAGGPAAKGFRVVSPPLPKDLDTAEGRAHVAAYQARYGEAPTSIYGVLAADAFDVLARAIADTRSTDGGELAAYLANRLEDYPGLTGRIGFDAKGDRVGEGYRVYEIDAAGSFVLRP